MFDNDTAGIEAAKDVASILSVGKAAICTLPLKTPMKCWYLENRPN